MSLRYSLNSIAFIFFFFLSYILIQPYTEGDQKHYIRLYEALSEASFLDILNVGFANVGSLEPLSMYILWIGSQLGVDKNVYISIWNAFLLLGFFIFAQKYRMRKIFVFLLITNFYVLVAMSGAERLKFALLALTYSFVFLESRRKVAYTLLLISPLFHFQSIIFLVGYVAYSFSKQLFDFFISFKIKYSFLLGLVFLLFFAGYVFYVFNDILLLKFHAYYQGRSFSVFYQALILSCAVLIVTNRRLQFISMLSVLCVFIYFLGGERVNMVAFILSLFFLIVEKRADHPVFLVLMFYFSVKSVFFINRVFLYGDGFHVCC